MTEQEWRDKFGLALKNMIASKGCTRREFAEEMGISEKTLDHYIHGRRTLNAFTLLNLAKFLDYSIDKMANFSDKS